MCFFLDAQKPRLLFTIRYRGGEDVARLVEVSSNSSDGTILDLIFVHGLEGHYEQTWCPAGYDSSWLQWLAEDHPDVRILTVSYDISGIKLSSINTQPLYDRAKNILDLFALRGIGGRPFGLICHSYGGLLAKQILRTARDSSSGEYRGIAEQLAFTTFLGTPHRGTAVATWIDRVGNLLTSVAVQELRSNSNALRELNEWFREYVSLNSPTVISYSESKPTKGVVVVKIEDTDLGIPGASSIALDEDHISISKPTSREEHVYLRVDKLISDQKKKSQFLSELEPHWQKLAKYFRAVPEEFRARARRMPLNPLIEELSAGLYFLGLASLLRRIRHTSSSMLASGVVLRAHPYPGIRPFHTDESPFFFGREEDVQSVFDKLARAGVALLCGESGVGKSSLLHAGVISRFDATGVQYFVFRPLECGDPLSSLIQATCPYQGGTDREELVAGLVEAGDPRALLGGNFTPDTADPVVLAIDQLEELWSGRVIAEERHKFLVILERIRRSLGWSLLLVLRSEFITRLLEEEPLRNECREGVLFLAPLTEAGVVSAVTRPAELAGFDVASSLLSRILSECDETGAGLPLLSCALRETFERANRRNARVLELGDYESFNGLRGVVESLCKDALRAYGGDAGPLLDGFFAPLVEIEPLTGRALRRTALKGEWSWSPPHETLVEAFVSHGLLVSDVNSKGEAIVEVAHEAIFSAWESFEAWIQQRKDDLRRIRRMQRDAVSWKEGGRAESDLYPHERLVEVKASIEAIGFKTDRLEDDFLAPEVDRIWIQLECIGLMAQERAILGDRLAEIGDHRRGVGASTSDIPEFDWVDCSSFFKMKDYAYFGVTSILVSRFPVTVEQYRSLVQGDEIYERMNLPVVQVSWDDATKYARAVSELEGKEVRLPTVSEWRRVAGNGDAQTLYPWGDCYREGIANTQAEGLNRRVAVGVFCYGRNRVAIHDLVGNVWEWCSDSEGDNTRYLCGGSYLRKRDGQVNNEHLLRVERNYRDFDLGFRLWKFV